MLYAFSCSLLLPYQTWDETRDLCVGLTIAISLCLFFLSAPDVVFYANKGVKIVVQMSFSEDNKTFNYSECLLCAVFSA